MEEVLNDEECSFMKSFFGFIELAHKKNPETKVLELIHWWRENKGTKGNGKRKQFYGRRTCEH